jgi:ergothioneine biosynthesis protein EgtB
VSARAPIQTIPSQGEPDVTSLGQRYGAVRRATEALAAPLSAEDCLVQSMPDASPVKWHLAHSSWFFESFVLARVDGYREYHPSYGYLWNSYYESLGARHGRAQRGVLSRPSLEEVRGYRAHVDAAVADALAGRVLDAPALAALELGLNHEQQHQELILTDLKHAFAQNALAPVYRARPAGAAAGMAGAASSPEAAPLRWSRRAEGLASIGHDGRGFSFDNEGPRHRVFLGAFELASRPVTNAEYAAFIEDRGYARPELWLSDGWDAVRAGRWEAPLYWRREADRYETFTLAGTEPVAGAEPVTHVSYFEADAYARWAGARLPTEAEWEVFAADARLGGHFVESGRLHPAPAPRHGAEVVQLFGDVWEWTASPYVAYPGFCPFEGAAGEYNGKFMSGQMVLRGGSCVSPASHLRASYRNFFRPDTRWQFSGIRLARDV